VLRYDWRAMAALKTLLGKDFLAKLDQVMMDAAADPEALANILAIGLQRNHPEMDAEKVMDLSPPIAAAVEVVATALARAFYGDKGPPKVDPRKAAPSPKAS